MQQLQTDFASKLNNLRDAFISNNPDAAGEVGKDAIDNILKSLLGGFDLPQEVID